MSLAHRKVLEGNYDEQGMILVKAAGIVRRDLLNMVNTKFNGSFSKMCQEDAIPVSLGYVDHFTADPLQHHYPPS